MENHSIKNNERHAHTAPAFGKYHRNDQGKCFLVTAVCSITGKVKKLLGYTIKLFRLPLCFVLLQMCVYFLERRKHMQPYVQQKSSLSQYIGQTGCILRALIKLLIVTCISENFTDIQWEK